MKKKYKRNGCLKRLGCLGMAGILAMSLAGCAGGGDSNNQNRTRANDIGDDYTYIPEYISISPDGENEDTQVSFYNAEYKDGDVYFTTYSWDEESGSRSILHRYSIKDQKDIRTWDITGKETENGSEGVENFQVSEDGELYVLFRKSSYSEDNYSVSYLLRLYDKDGNMTKEQDITDSLSGGRDGYVYIQNMALDKDKRIYLTGDAIYLFEADLKFAGKIDSSFYIHDAGTGKDGRVYVSTYDNGRDGGNVLYAIDFEKKALGEKYQNFISPNGNGGLTAGVDADFMASDSVYVYEYSLADQKAEKLFSWIDCDISGDYVQGIYPMEDGTILAMVNDWENGENSLVILKKTPSDQVAQKEQIVFGMLYPSSQYTSQIVAFNKQSDKYHITVRSYMDTIGNSQSAYEDGIAAFNNALISGQAPDIVAVESLESLASLAAKGVFVDLKGYLDKSSTLKKEDIFENVLESNTYSDTLVCIPKTFMLFTMSGKTSKVGEKRGWTIDDMIALGKANPDAELFDGFTKEAMLYYMTAFNMDSFIDYETGACHFDSEDFKKLLQLANEFPEDYNWSEDQESEQSLMARDKVLLHMDDISSFEDIQLSPAMFGEEVTYVGFPTTDGSVGCMLQMEGGYAVTASSQVKDGAWEFIEFCLNSDSDRYSWGFPVFKSRFDQAMEEVTKVEYLTDENGELMLDEEGNPIPTRGGGGVGYNDWYYEYHICTEEEAELVKELVMEARSGISAGLDTNIFNILSEESAPYFQGQKSVDEAADIIQSRIKLYISE